MVKEKGCMIPSMSLLICPRHLFLEPRADIHARTPANAEEEVQCPVRGSRDISGQKITEMYTKLVLLTRTRLYALSLLDKIKV